MNTDQHPGPNNCFLGSTWGLGHGEKKAVLGGARMDSGFSVVEMIPAINCPEDTNIFSFGKARSLPTNSTQPAFFRGGGGVSWANSDSGTHTRIAERARGQQRLAHGFIPVCFLLTVTIATGEAQIKLQGALMTLAESWVGVWVPSFGVGG